jgi:cullin 3
LNDRDIFHRECEHHYKGRLLNKTVKSTESEEQFLKLIAAESGGSATTKMKNMSKDIALSKDFVNNYYEKVKATPDAIKIESVQCLTASSWSVEAAELFPLEMPLSLKKLYESFDEWYKTKHHRKVL